MVYFLKKDRNADAVASYRRYQEYLQEHKHMFPPGAFALGTAEWYQNASDLRCPHDAWLDNVTISETVGDDKNRATTIHIRLLGAYHDGYIELSYPRAFGYSLIGSVSTRGLGDWLYDEFRLSPRGHLIHEIEWSGSPPGEDSRWIIEASDIELRWFP